MDFSELEYSEAGDSGWTMYLDHSSSVSLHNFDVHNGETKRNEHDEDSSMVSDASSGPPYYSEEAVLAEDNTQYWCKNKLKNKNKKKKKKVHEEQGYIGRFNSCLDDTASSLPVREEVSVHKQHRDQYQRLDDFSQSHSTRRMLKGKFKSGFVKPVEKLALEHQDGSNQRKRRG